MDQTNGSVPTWALMPDVTDCPACVLFKTIGSRVKCLVCWEASRPDEERPRDDLATHR